jgi:hypothetical protein
MRLSESLVLSLVLLLSAAAWSQAGAPTTPPPNECLGYAQHPDLRPDKGESRPAPTVTFRLEMPTFNPRYYGIAVEADGKAAYQSEPQAGSLPGDPYLVKFTMSDPTRQRIFALAAQAGYFRGDFDYRKSKIANTGAKTLSYADGDRCNQTTYNWSENPAIQQLTTIFQEISATMEHGRQLAFLHRFDKLGLDAELKSMEAAARSNSLLELQTIAPILQSIASDYAVMKLARARAERLLARAQAGQ